MEKCHKQLKLRQGIALMPTYQVEILVFYDFSSTLDVYILFLWENAGNYFNFPSLKNLINM